jgi:hypothetical protein
MRIVQTVFGVFHHFELARKLERRGHLKTLGGWEDYGDRWEALLKALIAPESPTPHPPPTK